MTAEALLPKILLWLVLPLWLAAGAADYLCHRQSDIEHTSGRPESWFHIVQWLQIMVAVSMGLFLQINLLVIAVMTLAVALHAGTGMWDAAYSGRYRHISALEQHVHGYLELLPMFALLLVIVLHWNELRAADLHLAMKTPPLPLAYSFGVLGALAFAALPIVEEWWRTGRHMYVTAEDVDRPIRR